MYRRFVKTLSLLLVVILCTLCACSKLPAGVETLPVEGGIFGNTGASAAALHTAVPSHYRTVASSEGVTLFYDPETASPAVTDESGAHWSALPEAENTSAAVLRVSVIGAKGRYYLNSQDHAVAYGTYATDFTADGFTVTYVLSDSPDVAKKDAGAVGEGELRLSIPVRFTLSDGALRVSVDCAKIGVSSGFIAQSLSLLPYFGALEAEAVPAAAEPAAPETPRETEAPTDTETETQAENETEAETPSEEETASPAEDADGETTVPEDNAPEEPTQTVVSLLNAASGGDRGFLLVPDGCGAVMYVDTPDAATSSLSFRLYEETEGELRASLGCFGSHRAGASVAAAITAGDTVASVKAMRDSANADGYFTVYPSFTLTPTEEKDGLYYSFAPFAGEAAVVYQFLHGKQSSYMGMAAACRETLIRAGYLRADTAAANAPSMLTSFVLSVNGSRDTLATTLEQAEELLDVMNGKGVGEVWTVLAGLFGDGVYQTDASSMRVPGFLGGKKALQSLLDAAHAQGAKVFAEVDPFVTSRRGRAAKTLTGENVGVFLKNPLYPALGGEGASRYYLRADRLKKNMQTLLDKLSGFAADGYAAPAVTYADFASGADKSAVAAAADALYAGIDAAGGLILKNADLARVRYADAAVDLPLTPSMAQNDAYRAVPLLPAVLRGSVVYAGSPVNAGQTFVLELLRCVEYGAAVYACWDFCSSSPYFYERSFSDVTEFYARVRAQTGDLSGERITGHAMVADGLYATVYENGSIVFVNYNNFSVNVDQISVPPYDFLRIN